MAYGYKKYDVTILTLDGRTLRTETVTEVSPLFAVETLSHAMRPDFGFTPVRVCCVTSRNVQV